MDVSETPAMPETLPAMETTKGGGYAILFPPRVAPDPLSALRRVVIECGLANCSPPEVQEALRALLLEEAP
jgi:hypothetical protein